MYGTRRNVRRLRVEVSRDKQGRGNFNDVGSQPFLREDELALRRAFDDEGRNLAAAGSNIRQSRGT